MSKALFFNFSVDKATNTITVKREFNARLPLVWTAWTKPQYIDQWWAAEGWKSESKSMTFEEGGHRHYLMTGPKGEAMWGLTSYDQIKLHEYFAGKDCFADEKAQINTEFPQSTYRVDFIDKGALTLIEHRTTYKQLEELEASLQYGFETGTVDAYARLDKVLVQR